jgi:hypothetical protein
MSETRIRLIQNLPVDAKHRAVIGAEFDAEPNSERKRNCPYWWITGASGERVGVFRHEAEEVEREVKGGRR